MTDVNEAPDINEDYRTRPDGAAQIIIPENTVDINKTLNEISKIIKIDFDKRRKIITLSKKVKKNRDIAPSAPPTPTRIKFIRVISEFFYFLYEACSIGLTSP